MSSTIRIGGVETFSSVDFPSKMAATVFIQGCPWRCPFCYNTALQNPNAPTDFIWEKFFEFLKTRTKILDAVVFSGGEPLMQDELLDAIDEVKSLGYQVAVHTGGYRPDMFEKVLKKINWVGFDIKAPFEEDRYRKAIGFKPSPSMGEARVAQPLAGSNSGRGVTMLESVRKSLDLLLQNGLDFECRTTCDPSILEVEDIYTIADTLHKLGVKNYHLQKYKPIAGDQVKDYHCDKFLTDKALESYLRTKFQSVELRS